MTKQVCLVVIIMLAVILVVSVRGWAFKDDDFFLKASKALEIKQGPVKLDKLTDVDWDEVCFFERDDSEKMDVSGFLKQNPAKNINLNNSESAIFVIVFMQNNHAVSYARSQTGAINIGHEELGFSFYNFDIEKHAIEQRDSDRTGCIKASEAFLKKTTFPNQYKSLTFYKREE